MYSGLGYSSYHIGEPSLISKLYTPALCIIESVDSISIIESVHSISRDERDVPLTQYITNA